MKISYSEYPGKIAHLINAKVDVHEKANAVLLENLDEKDINLIYHYKGLGKSVGLKTDGTNLSALKQAIQTNILDFIVLDIKDETNPGIGLVRASGVDYEIRYLGSFEQVGAVYDAVIPCKHFVILSKNPMEFMDFVKDKENVTVRG